VFVVALLQMVLAGLVSLGRGERMMYSAGPSENLQKRPIALDSESGDVCMTGLHLDLDFARPMRLLILTIAQAMIVAVKDAETASTTWRDDLEYAQTVRFVNKLWPLHLFVYIVTVDNVKHQVVYQKGHPVYQPRHAPTNQRFHMGLNDVITYALSYICTLYSSRSRFMFMHARPLLSL